MACYGEKILGNMHGTVPVTVEIVRNASLRDGRKHSSKVGDTYCTRVPTPGTGYPPVTYSASNLRRVSEMSLALFWA